VQGLTVRQRRFVEAYTGNATEAAIKAGYSGKTANRIAAENLSKPVISAAIAAATAERGKRTEITLAKRTLQNLTSL
jgi:phage terminase small subunit